MAINNETAFYGRLMKKKEENMLPTGIMITENDVVDTVISELERLEFEIISSCHTDTKGIDIIAKKDNRKILIEAKGGTTSIQSGNEGRPFTRNQVRSHVSVAIFKILQLKEENRDALLGIALPYERHHYEFIESIKTSLKELGIIIFWCNKEGVKIENINLIKNL